MMKVKQGDTEHTEAIKTDVEKNTAVIDNVRNNPETQIKMIVTNKKKNEVTKVVMKFYHTNQSIHLQGGKRMGMMTSTSFLADHMEKKWRTMMTNNLVKIQQIISTLKTMTIKQGMNLRNRTNSGDQIFSCDKCCYKSPMKHQLNAHKMSIHAGAHEQLKTMKRKSLPSKIQQSKVTKQKITQDNLTAAIELTKSTVAIKDQDNLNITEEVKIHNANECKECGFI